MELFIECNQTKTGTRAERVYNNRGGDGPFENPDLEFLSA